MTRLEEIRQLYAYNRWANAEILTAGCALPADAYARDLGSSFPSVRDTLVHILGAEWVWLCRWQGSSPRSLPEDWAASTQQELTARWAQVEADQTHFLAGLTEQRLDDVIAYTNFAGTALESPLWQMLRHVVNHSTYHRGQVVTMLRQLGFAPPSTDLIHYHRESAAAHDQPART
ncbi:MAG: DinB family protein [Longimicrobiales bacterium]